MTTETYWIGGGNDGDWANAANWSVAVPSGTTYVAIIDDTADTIDTSLNQASVVLEKLTITAGFKGNIGGAGTSLEIDSALTTIAGSGGYVNIDGDHTTMIVQPPGNSNINIVGDAITTLRIVRGTVTVGTGVAVTNMEVDGGSVEIGANGTQITSYKQNSGSVISERNMSTARMSGGTLALEVAAGITNICDLGGSATLLKRSSGAIGTLTKFGSATYSMSQATDDTTVTTGFIYGGRFDRSGGGVSTTVTTESNYAGGGGNT